MPSTKTLKNRKTWTSSEADHLALAVRSPGAASGGERRTPA